MSNIDLKSLVAEVEEARELLKRKADLEKELQQGQKRLDRIQATHAAEERGLEETLAQHQKARDNFEHERNRFAIDLDEHQRLCAESKRATQEANDAELRAANLDIEAFRDRVAGEKRALEAEIRGLSALRTAIKVEIADLRKRIDLLS